MIISQSDDCFLPQKNMVVCVIKRQAQHSLRSESSPAPCGDTPESSPTPCGDTAESSPSPCGDTPESSSSPCGDTPESSPAPCGNTPESSPTPCTDTPESNPPLYNSAPPPVRMYQRQSSQKVRRPDKILVASLLGLHAVVWGY